MADRPIRFSAPMVRALLEGRKTQTRRVLTARKGGRPVMYALAGLGEPFNDHRQWGIRYWDRSCDCEEIMFLPDLARRRYQVGDRLWVREAFSYDRLDIDHDGLLPAWYWADGNNPGHGDWTKPKPSIHMPRAYSRLTLIVTDVRVQRLQEISEADAIAEGFAGEPGELWPIDWYRDLWEDLNAARGYGWESNPWVVALTFNVIKANIDSLQEAA